ncbi:MAG: DUF5060 domain-containing protein, partial [Bacteroidota bacterium]
MAIFKKLLAVFVLLHIHTMYSQSSVSGELREWHKITVEFNSSTTYTESGGTNPFRDRRLNVTFTSPSGKSYLVPGYFAADGNAGESSASSGNKWKVHFTPSETGTWNYVASFRSGTNIAASTSANAGTPSDFNGTSGSFSVSGTNKSGKDFRSKGKLEYVGEHFLQWSNGEYFLKFGANSPEVFLEYADFDGTNSSRTYSSHTGDWENGDPTWKNGKGKGIIGVANYLSDEGMNVHYFLTMNAYGDGKQAFPWTGRDNYYNYDVSKLDQWQIVFDHMMTKGIMVHFVTTEQENQSYFEEVEGGTFANSRKVYYRELVARFGYLNAITWNIGEESGWDFNNSYGEAITSSQRISFADYFDELTYYDDHISVHNGPSNTDAIFNDLLGSNAYTGPSFQGNLSTSSHGHGRILHWREESAASNKKWVVSYDEPFSSIGNPGATLFRDNAVWASLTAGGAGVEYYAGGGRDLSIQDYRANAAYWEAMRNASDFFTDNSIPFYEMENSDSSVSSGWCLAKNQEVYVIYLPSGGSTNIQISGNDNYTVKWYDPRNGGNLLNGSTTSITAGGSRSVGNPPNNASSDWVVLLERESGGGNDDPPPPTGCDADYEEVNNLVVIETENLSFPSGWDERTSASGFSGTGYLEWTGSNNFNTPGQGTITVKIQINDPGTYRFQWRNKVGTGNNSTEHNDSWLRFPDADDFFGQRGNSIIYPKGSGKTPTPNGGGADGWFKIYLSGTTNWTWSTNTSDNDPHQIYATFDSPGIYTMEISGRSTNHLIDRIVLSKDVSNTTDLSLQETPCGSSGENVPVTGLSVTPSSASLDVGDTIDLNFTVSPSNATNKNVTWTSSNNALATVNANGRVTALAEGNVTITARTQDGGFTDTSAIQIDQPNKGVDALT